MPTRIFSRRPERLADALDLVAQLVERVVRAADGGGLADAGRRAVLAERVAQRLRPLAGRHARAGGRDRRGHDVLVRLRRDARELGERGVDGGLVALGAPALERLALLRPRPPGRRRRMPPSASAVSGEGSVSV